MFCLNMTSKMALWWCLLSTNCTWILHTFMNRFLVRNIKRLGLRLSFSSLAPVMSDLVSHGSYSHQLTYIFLRCNFHQSSDLCSSWLINWINGGQGFFTTILSCWVINWYDFKQLLPRLLLCNWPFSSPGQDSTHNRKIPFRAAMLIRLFLKL